jgi:hypothetical protein
MTFTTGRTEIALSKSKMLFLLLGAIGFVAAGFWFVIDPPEIRNAFWGDPTKLAILGYASILFFGAGAIYLIGKLRDNKPGLIIDDTGLVDNSGALSVGHIPWLDIENISVFEMNRQKLIMLHVANPQHYIDRQKNTFKRKLMAMNHRMYGTPVSISVNGLKTSFDDLMALLTQHLQEAKNRQPTDIQKSV